MMNWTGGRRSRHSHTNARSLAAIRKQHFANARANLQGRTHSPSPFTEFISAIEGYGPRKQVNELGVSKGIRTQEPPKSRDDCHTGVRNVRPTSSKVSEISATARVNLGELDRDDLASLPLHINAHGRKDYTGLSDRKRELLMRDDWVVTAVTRPLKIKYSSAVDRKIIGRPRRLTRHTDRHVEFPSGGFVGTTGQQEPTVQIGYKLSSGKRESPFTGHVEIDMDESSYCKTSSEPMLFDDEGPGHPEVTGCCPRSRDTNPIVSAYPRRDVFTPSPIRLKHKQNGNFRHHLHRIIPNQNLTASSPPNEAMELGLQRTPHPEISPFDFLREEESFSEIWPPSRTSDISDCRSWMEDKDAATNSQSQYDNYLGSSSRMNNMHFTANRMSDPLHPRLGHENATMTGNTLRFTMHKDLHRPDDPMNFFTNRSIPTSRICSTPAKRTDLDTSERSEPPKVSSDCQYWNAWLSNVIGGDCNGSGTDKCVDMTSTRKLEVIYQQPTSGIDEVPGSMLPEQGSQTPPLAEPVEYLFGTAPKWLQSPRERLDLDQFGLELANMNGSLKLASVPLHQNGIDEEARVWQRFVIGDVHDEECISGLPERAARWQSGTTDNIESDTSLAVLHESVEDSEIIQGARSQTSSSTLPVSFSSMRVARKGRHHSYQRKFQTQPGDPRDCLEPESDHENRSLRIQHRGLELQAPFVDNAVHSASTPYCADGSWPSSLENHFGDSRKDEVSPLERSVTRTHLAIGGQAATSGKHSARRRKMTFRKLSRNSLKEAGQKRP